MAEAKSRTKATGPMFGARPALADSSNDRPSDDSLGRDRCALVVTVRPNALQAGAVMLCYAAHASHIFHP
jgi:hypothetical protein